MVQFEMKQNSPEKRLFVLAHPDDELMCIPLLLEPNCETFILYLTDSDYGERIREAELFISKMRSYGTQIQILKLAEQLSDGNIHTQATSSLIEECIILANSWGVDKIVTTAYEGGHQDHDSCFVVSFITSNLLNIPLFQFSTYRQGPLSYSVMVKLSNAKIIKFSKVRALIQLFLGIYFYRSQKKTWFGLGFFVMMRYLRGEFNSFSRVEEEHRIVVQDIFYERRKRADRHHVINAHRNLLRKFSMEDALKI